MASTNIAGTLRRSLLIKVISKPAPSKEDVNSVIELTASKVVEVEGEVEGGVELVVVVEVVVEVEVVVAGSTSGVAGWSWARCAASAWSWVEMLRTHPSSHVSRR